MKALLDRVLDGATLCEADAEGLMDALACGEAEPATIAALLAALRLRGETADEVAGFARSLRRHATPPDLVPVEGAADTCGTGGDASQSLNLSTGAALLVAACGVPIVKHGNRSVSSRAGSADVLEALGVPVTAPGVPRATLAAARFAFLFAPHHHPALARVMPVRRALGVRTVFNLLGPLVSPAAPPFQVTGAYSVRAARVMAGALARLGTARALVVHGAEGWDEATPIGPFTAIEVRDGQITESVRDPLDLGLPRCRPDALRGSDGRGNARRLRAVLEGSELGPHRDALLLGAALVLEVTGRARDAREGVALAREAIDRGEGEHVLARLVESARAAAAAGAAAEVARG
jgi:anthranilate phosphoribosyltransferase